jgi:hypothetical protein
VHAAEHALIAVLLVVVDDLVRVPARRGAEVTVARRDERVDERAAGRVGDERLEAPAGLERDEPAEEPLVAVGTRRERRVEVGVAGARHDALRAGRGGGQEAGRERREEGESHAASIGRRRVADKAPPRRF